MTKDVGDTTKPVGGPDELRKAAERLACELGDMAPPIVALRAAADAWKADLEWHREQTEGVWAANAVLRQRLEAAESLRRFASACRMAVGGRMDDYLYAVYALRDDPVTEKAGLTDLAWALLQGGNVSRGDWDGFVKHWLAAALAGKEKP
jgi:hypothetical protein